MLRKSRVANFADIIKIQIMFIKSTFKDSNKVKRNRNYVLKCSLCPFLCYEGCWFPVKKADASTTKSVCHVIYIIFGFSLGGEWLCQVSLFWNVYDRF